MAATTTAASGAAARHIRQRLAHADVPLMPDWPWHSRVHPLRLPTLTEPSPALTPAALSAQARRFWIKRDDELGGVAAGGSKLRKYGSYLAAALQRGVKAAVVLGGVQSNNTAAAATLLLQHGITPYLCLRRPRTPVQDATPVGNALLWRLVVPETRVHWTPADCGITEMERLAKDYADHLVLSGAQAAPVDVLPEGANHEDAWAGALILADDVAENALSAQNQRQASGDVAFPSSPHFDHVFVDAGTGMTAAALVVGLALQRFDSGGLLRPPTVHVVLVAADAARFEQQVDACVAYSVKKFGPGRPDIVQGLRSVFPPYRLHSADHAGRRFGPGTRAVFETIHEHARRNGLLLDPVYSGKLMLETQHVLANDDTLVGEILIIHSGGVPALFGFTERLFSGTSASPP